MSIMTLDRLNYRSMVDDEMESEEDEIYIDPQLQDSRFMPDGNYYQPKIVKDYEIMIQSLMPIPDQERRSCFYAIEHEGINYHVFNAERIVNKFN